MRILQSLYDAGGGVPPQLAITRRLVERGHDVRVLAHESLRSRVEDRGAQFVPFRATLPGHDMTRAETDLVRDWEPADPLVAAGRFRDLVLFGPAADNAREVLATLAEWPADTVVLDWLLFGTALAAEKAGVPAVALVHCPYPLRLSDAGDEFFAPGLKVMNDARRDLGLTPVERWDQQLLGTEQILMLTIPALDASATGPLPGNVRYVGPAFEPCPQTWTSPWPANDDRPLVVVSFSTTFMDQRNLADRVLRAVDGLAVRVLLTIGPALRVDGLHIPDNVFVTPYAPHCAVLRHAALTVTHAGFGTVQAAAAAGVPMVCVPTGRDQPGNAARIAELGAGVAVDPAAGPDELRAAVSGALVDQTLAEHAAELAREMARYDGTAAAVDTIEELA